MKLIGRDAELAVVREQLWSRKNLVVVGPEGVGKTALIAAATKNMPGVLYCADTATLKTASQSLLAQLGLSVAEADNVQRKRAILGATAGKDLWLVFDHVQHVSPKLLSLLENLRESHPIILLTRSLAWSDIGHLKMILWDFVRLELANLRRADAVQLIRARCRAFSATPPDPSQFEREIWQLSRGNPGRIVELCERAASGRYVFGRRLSARLLDLDRRMAKLGFRELHSAPHQAK